MNVLVVKLGATGDVVRTTPLLRRLTGHITWLTAAKNKPLIEGLMTNLRCLSWEERDRACDRTYDLVISLEDDLDSGRFVKTLKADRLFGASVDGEGRMAYTDDSRGWFDLSLISVYGKEAADRLKAKNRRTYQDLIFSGLGLRFDAERYLLPEPSETDLKGDVAIAPEGGPVWPMKNWAYYDQLKLALEARGLTVNVLPLRSSLLEHLADVRNHRCLISGDSLPMHFALGCRVRCVTLFTCTSPWEIHDYDVQTKIVSPLLEEFFYQRGFDRRATTAIGVDEVQEAVLAHLDGR
jgi:heptosyltransferase II